MTGSRQSDIVYVLTEFYDCEGRALLGVYRTREGARQAALRELAQPYGADAYVVDKVMVGTRLKPEETDWMDRVRQ